MATSGLEETVKDTLAELPYGVGSHLIYLANEFGTGQFTIGDSTETSQQCGLLEQKRLLIAVARASHQTTYQLKPEVHDALKYYHPKPPVTPVLKKSHHPATVPALPAKAREKPVQRIPSVIETYREQTPKPPIPPPQGAGQERHWYGEVRPFELIRTSAPPVGSPRPVQKPLGRRRNYVRGWTRMSKLYLPPPALPEYPDSPLPSETYGAPLPSNFAIGLSAECKQDGLESRIKALSHTSVLQASKEASPNPALPRYLFKIQALLFASSNDAASHYVTTLNDWEELRNAFNTRNANDTFTHPWWIVTTRGCSQARGARYVAEVMIYKSWQGMHFYGLEIDQEHSWRGKGKFASPVNERAFLYVECSGKIEDRSLGYLHKA